MSLPQLKPSPVHESSLRQALLRVEDRLRQQDEQRKKDEHHSRTLKIARELAIQGVRQRQQAWERHQHQRQSQNRTISPRTDSVYSEQPGPMHAGLERKKTAIPQEQHDAGPTPTVKKSPKPAAPLSHENAARSMPSQGNEQPQAAKPMATPLPQQPIEDVLPHLAITHPKGLMRLMPLVAWLILGAGVIGAVLSWTTLTIVQASTLHPFPVGLDSQPLGLLLGFAYLATGVLGFAFFWVSSSISNQLGDIRRLLFLQPIAMQKPDESPSQSRLSAVP